MFCKMILFLILSILAAGQNLLENGDFESGTVKNQFSNGYPDGWEGWGSDGWHHADVGYRRDNYGIAIWGNSTGCMQAISVSEGESFQVSGEMIYSAGEVLVNKNAQLKIEFWDGPDSTDNQLSQIEVGLLTPSHTAATWYSFSETVTAPASATEARLICQTVSTGSDSTGKAFWDNLSVEDGGTINDPDYNDDDTVNFMDFSMLAGTWAQESAAYNLSGQNIIDLEDLLVMAESWLPTVPQYPGYTFVWSDEFNGSEIDASIWNWEIGDSGWGNKEWQYYTNDSDNSYISDGNLVIAARKDHLGHDYTSARMTTQNKQSFQYGRLEARIKLPAGGQGIWPAFWMLGDNYSSIGWPECGELDILEVINDFTDIHGTIHYGSSDPYIHDSNGGSCSPAADVSEDYHIYAIEWEPTVIRWYFDDVNYYTTSSWWANEAYPAPFNHSFFFILNIAVGGNWPGYPDDSTPFPQLMYVDYIRVFEKTDS